MHFFLKHQKTTLWGSKGGVYTGCYSFRFVAWASLKFGEQGDRQLLPFLSRVISSLRKVPERKGRSRDLERRLGPSTHHSFVHSFTSPHTHHTSAPCTTSSANPALLGSSRNKWKTRFPTREEGPLGEGVHLSVAAPCPACPVHSPKMAAALDACSRRRPSGNLPTPWATAPAADPAEPNVPKRPRPCAPAAPARTALLSISARQQRSPGAPPPGPHAWPVSVPTDATGAGRVAPMTSRDAPTMATSSSWAGLGFQVVSRRWRWAAVASDPVGGGGGGALCKCSPPRPGSGSAARHPRGGTVAVARRGRTCDAARARRAGSGRSGAAWRAEWPWLPGAAGARGGGPGAVGSELSVANLLSLFPSSISLGLFARTGPCL